YGALTTFIQALALKVFGPYLIVIRLTTVFFYSLSAVLLYYIWRNFLSPSFFWITYGMFLVLPPFYGWIFNPWSSIYALFFMLLANIFMINFIRRGSVLWLWGAGVSSALTFWCRQPNGIVMYLALVLFFAICLALEWKSWRRILNNIGICTAAYVN
ncbi:MAG: glycosyltransferase family 39 protein, partial [Lentisphaerae bacterium]|nr:glycosyltransferase family 39 protein [Lentisphaerota bacterium]